MRNENDVYNSCVAVFNNLDHCNCCNMILTQCLIHTVHWTHLDGNIESA